MALATTRRHKPVDDSGDLDPDLVAKLPPGFSDPKHPNFVPPELRTIVAGFDPEFVAKVRWELRNVRGTMIRSGPTGRIHKVEPHLNSDDLDVGVGWRLTDLARRQLTSDKAAADRAAYDAVVYRCRCCGEVHVPGLTNRNQTMARTFANGARAKTCGECAIAIEHLAVEAIAAEEVNGQTRLDHARALLEWASE